MTAHPSALPSPGHGTAVDPSISVDEFAAEAQTWLERHSTLRAAADTDFAWGQGDFDVSVFHNLSHDAEAAHIGEIVEWLQLKATRGYHAIAWPIEHGGLGLSRRHARAFGRLERRFDVPGAHELVSVTTNLISNTIRVFGTPEQQARFVGPLLRGDLLACQLFSEPGAGSDLAGLACRAEQDGDEWVINGQKVWSSGAQFGQYGELIARTDVDAVKHRGMTAFMLPLDIDGVEVRPIRQMSGGSSFCEVFFNDARVPDSLRLGAVGDGWNVALTTLGFERDHSDSGAGGRTGGSFRELLGTAVFAERTADPVVRDLLAQAFIRQRVETLTNRRAADLARSGTPGPEGSLGKLLWTENMNFVSAAVSRILGPKLIADTGEWGTYAWGHHLLGAPGYRIAGGSDEVQRNILGERVLGLPKEPRADDGPWKQIPR